MGTGAEVVVVGGPADAAGSIVERIHDLERRWTRFDERSELSRLNRSQGALTVLEPDTYRLLAAAVEGWHRTAGSYDPTVGRAMAANGYDRDLASIGTAVVRSPAEAPGCAGIVLVPEICAIGLPPGIELDVGGIGKGHAADLLVDEAIHEMGADGACVNIGGDVRVAGTPPQGDAWIIELGPTSAAPPRRRVALVDGAVATSRTDLRTWASTQGARHHVLDPSTGRPTDTTMRSVSVVAGTATVAELVTKAVLVAGPDDAARVVDELGAAALVIDREGAQRAIGALSDYLV